MREVIGGIECARLESIKEEGLGEVGVRQINHSVPSQYQTLESG